MASYRIHMIDKVGKRCRFNYANCTSDGEALALAQRMINKPHATAEVWCGEKLIAVVSLTSVVALNDFASPWDSTRSKA